MFFGSMQDTGCLMLDARYRILDVRYWKHYQCTKFPLLPGGVSRGTEMFWSKIMCEGGGGFWKDAGYSILDS
jgi:hypothetical protein